MKKFKRVMATAIAITALFTTSMSPVTVSAAATAKATQPKATAAVSAAKMKKNGELTEDELKATEKKIQDVTDKYVKQVDEITAAKNKEILSI